MTFSRVTLFANGYISIIIGVLGFHVCPFSHYFLISVII